MGTRGCSKLSNWRTKSEANKLILTLLKNLQTTKKQTQEEWKRNLRFNALEKPTND